MAKPKDTAAPKEKKASLDDVLNAITKQAEAFGTLTEVMTKAMTPPPAPPQVVDLANSTAAAVSSEPVKIVNGFPVPTEYQELVNTMLNKNFEVQINYQPDTAAFEFAILVPKNYSNAGDAHWNTYKEDRRSKVIDNAFGANGVRNWVQKIYDNFNDETKSRITYDRSLI